MTRGPHAGWNNRVWDRWKVPQVLVGGVYCGFMAWNAAGSTNYDGNHAIATYALQAFQSSLRAGQGAYTTTGFSEPTIAGVTKDETSFFEVHLTSTGADLKFNGNKIYTIAQAPADTKYRFACATVNPNTGFSDLAYFTTPAPAPPPLPPPGPVPEDSSSMESTPPPCNVADLLGSPNVGDLLGEVVPPDDADPNWLHKYLEGDFDALRRAVSARNRQLLDQGEPPLSCAAG